MAAFQPVRNLVTTVSSPPLGAQVAYTFATLLTKPEEYVGMRDSFERQGFTTADCEFLVVDNSVGNVADGYRGANALLSAARGDIVILLHQDVLAIHSRAILEERLADVAKRDPNWAVAGAAGGVRVGEVVGRWRQGRDEVIDYHHGRLPSEAASVDEMFMVIRRDSGVRVSSDLTGFHMYGADICMMAHMAGYGAWIIDYPVHHLAGVLSNDSEGLQRSVEQFRRKWNRVMKVRAVQTTCTFLFVGLPLADNTVVRLVSHRLARLARSHYKRQAKAAAKKG